ncbi:MAG TPA: hypothetical protein VIR02_03715 [Anaerolineales bacterium]
MNPILPIQHFVPDVEARQWKDGRIYLYGSYDISGRTSYCSWEYRVFSSDDLVHWEDHGQSFRSAPPNTSLSWADAPCSHQTASTTTDVTTFSFATPATGRV